MNYKRLYDCGRFKVLCFKRFFTTPSPKPTTSKPRHVEMSYREGNETPSPYDVLYRNPSSIANRLRLYELRRLTEQLKVDMKDLCEFGKTAFHEFNHIDQDFIELRTEEAISFPGTAAVHNPLSTGAVTVTIPVKSLKFEWEGERDKLYGLLGGEKESFTIRVDDFPFKNQNRKKASEIIKQIIDFCRDTSQKLDDDLKFKKHPNNRIKKTKNREFPREWLNFEKKEKEEEKE